MLADDVLQLQHDRNWGYNGWSGCYANAYTILRNEVQRFVLSPEVSRSAAAVMNLPLAAQPKALQLCRLPFPRCWLEWRNDDGGREGALVIADDHPLVGSCLSVQQRPGHPIYCWPMMTMFNWKEDFRLSNEFGKNPLTDADWGQCLSNNPQFAGQRDEWNELGQRHKVAIDPTMWDEQRVRTDGQEALNGIYRVRALLLLLNSRNIVGTEPCTPDPKLQRARAKCGKKPLLDFTRVDIRLSRIMARRAGEAADPREPMRLHLVRGHFKLRRTGVFWWSPHPRGTAVAGAIREQLPVVAS
jgi:hypothetical protein